MWKRPDNDKDPMYLDAFNYVAENPSPFRYDEYMTMCMNMSDEDELPFSEGSEELKQAMRAVKDSIIGDPSYGVLDLIKEIRVKENIPRSHFWWYIDEL